MAEETKSDPRDFLTALGWYPEGNVKPPRLWMHRDAIAWVQAGKFSTGTPDYEFSPAELRAFAQLAEESGS
jgi:hypothetical protein